MKNLQFVCALICGAAALASCNKNLSREQYPLPEEGEKCVLNVNAFSSLQVKSTGTVDAVTSAEKTIKSLQVFVFRGDMLDAYGKANTSTLSLTCTAGSRQVYALVNAPDLSSISSKKTLLSTVVDLNANATNALVMVGNKTVDLPTTAAVGIPVSRMVSRIVLPKITRDFESASLQELSFTIESIYICDAAGDGSVDGTAANKKWYNESSNKNEAPSLLYDKVSKAVANNASYATTHYFYTMPNNNEVKKTKLVIEAKLAGTTYYYPVELPALAANKSYEFTGITVKRPGSDTPDTPVSSSSISFSVSVVDWTVVPVSEKII